MKKIGIDWSDELNTSGELQRLEVLSSGVDKVIESNNLLQESYRKIIKQNKETISHLEEILELNKEKNKLAKDRLVQIMNKLLKVRVSEDEQDWNFSISTPKRDKKMIVSFAENHNAFMRDVILDIKHIVDNL